MLSSRRIGKEIDNLKKNQTFKIFKIEGDFAKIIFVFKGPPNTPYQMGHFKVELSFQDYPFKCPKINFLTYIYHPNITENGEVCERPFIDSWNPQNKISDALNILYQIIAQPDLSSPLREDVAAQYTNDYNTFVEEAKKQTNKFALPTEDTSSIFDNLDGVVT